MQELSKVGKRECDIFFLASHIRSPAPLSLLLFPPFFFFFLSSLFALTRQPSLSHQDKIFLSKDEIKSLTLRFCGCYQFPSLSSFDCRLSVPLLSVSRFYLEQREP
nr:hypothetical protein CFP56_15717 [Quercus suber]